MKVDKLSNLFELGLIFEINRQVLHPLGYSIAFKKGSEEEPDSLVLLKTDDEEGCLFPESNFMDGASKFSMFMRTYGEEAIRRRINRLGFIRQTRSDQ